MVSFKLGPLYYWENGLQYLLDKKLGRFQSRFGRGDVGKKSLPLPGIEDVSPSL
jgi:hypothetical protein